MRGWLIAAGVGLLMAGGATHSIAQTQPFYITNGDSSIAYIVQNGVLQSSFPTFPLAYPLAVRNTALIHHRDDTGATEYSLAGAPTGTTYTGNGAFTQLLDGTTDGTQFNYGVECCDAVNSVVQTNLNWEGSTALFTLQGGTGGQGIAYDTTDDTLFVSTFEGGIDHYSLTGTLLGSFPAPRTNLCCLAFEESSGTLWGLERGPDDLIQFDKTTGAILQTIDVPGFSAGNAFGGEMASAAGPAPVVVPTLTEWAMILLAGLLGLAGLTTVYRRRQSTI